MRVLIVSIYFYPSPSIGGKRPTRLTRYLLSMGDSVSVICPHPRYLRKEDISEGPCDAHIVGTFLLRFGPDSIFGRNEASKYTIVNKMVNIFKKASARILAPIQVPDRSMPWIPFAVTKALHTIKEMPPDVIYVSCPEYGANVAGALIQKITGVPLVIDYDDPWTTFEIGQSRFQRILNRRLETFALERATHIVANTKEMADSIRNAFREIDSARKCHAIHSGFSYYTEGSYKPDSDFGLQLVHAGNMYGERSAKTLVQAMLRLRKNKTEKGIPAPTLTSYGRIDDDSKKILSEEGEMNLLDERSFLPYTACMTKLCEADALVLFVSPQHWRQIPGKLFDYISCNRPIMAFVGSGKSSVKRIIGETGVGVVLHIDDIETTERVLREWAERKARGKLLGMKKKEKLNTYHKSEEIKQLREVLISACKHKRRRAERV